MTKLTVKQYKTTGAAKIAPAEWSPPVKGARSRKSSCFSLCDGVLLAGFILGAVALGLCMVFVACPWYQTQHMEPATCQVEKITGDRSTEKPSAKDGASPGPLGGNGDWDEEHDDDDDKPNPLDRHGHPGGPPPPGPGGRHGGPGAPPPPGPGGRHGRPGGRHQRRSGSEEGADGFEKTDADGFMKCKECHFFSKSGGKRTERGFFYNHKCELSKFPCKKVIVSYDSEDTSGEDSSSETEEDFDSKRDDDFDKKPHRGRRSKFDHRRDGEDDNKDDRPDLSRKEPFEDIELPGGVGILYPDFEQMESFPQCSYSSCDQSNQENEQNVNEWLAGYVAKQESGEEFDCYYNPEEPEKVYVGKVYSETEVVNAVLWPALFTVVCLLALVGRRIYFKCIKKQTAPREMPYTVSAPQTKPDQTQDPEKNPTQLGAEAGSQAAGPVAAAPPLELKAPPEYSEIVEASGGRPVAFILPPTYSEANLHKAAKEPLPPCDA